MLPQHRRGGGDSADQLVEGLLPWAELEEAPPLQLGDSKLAPAPSGEAPGELAH